MRLSPKKVAVTLAVSAVTAAALFTGISSGSAAPRGLTAIVADTAGNSIGTVRFVPSDDGAVRVTARLAGLAAGFHGFHVHTTGTCDPSATDPSGNAFPFGSAGGHYNPDATSIHGDHAGDMPSLFAMTDGSALLRFKTDRFTTRQLLDSDGSAVIVHAAADNFAHIPGSTSAGGERYHSHVEDVLGPDTATKATGDAGARFACGVVRKA